MLTSYVENKCKKICWLVKKICERPLTKMFKNIELLVILKMFGKNTENVLYKYQKCSVKIKNVW